MKEDVIQISPDVLSGTPVFKGTRVPVTFLFDYLEEGEPLEEFLEGYPSVTREQAVAVLEIAERLIIQHDLVNENPA